MLKILKNIKNSFFILILLSGFSDLEAKNGVKMYCRGSNTEVKIKEKISLKKKKIIL